MSKNFRVQPVTIRCSETLRFTTVSLARVIVVLSVKDEFLQICEFGLVGKLILFGETFVKILYPSEVQKTSV